MLWGTVAAQSLGVTEGALLIDGERVEVDAATLRQLQDQQLRQYNEGRSVVGVGRAYRTTPASPMEKVRLVSDPVVKPEIGAEAQAGLKFSDRYVPFMVYPNTPALGHPWAGATQYVGNNIHIYPQDPTHGLARSLGATLFGPWLPGVGPALPPVVR